LAITQDDLKRFQERMARMMEDFGLDSREGRRIQERFGSLLDEFGASPQADLQETEEELILRIDLPGVEKKDVELTIWDEGVKIKASRTIPPGDYLMKERRTGFEREYDLPVPVRGDQARAKLEGGVLEISIPREVTSRRRVNVE